MKGRPINRILVVAGGLITIFVAFRLWGIDGSWFSEENILSFGPMAPLVFTAMFSVAVILAVPGGPITLLAGSLFGVIQGTIVVSAGSTIGAMAAFLIARYAARDHVARWLADNPRFLKLDEMIRKKGFIVVALVRLIPLFPFNLVNYGMGLTSVSFGYYLFMSWLCMLPGTILYVTGGDVFKRFFVGGDLSWQAISLCGAIALCLSGAYIVLRNSLREESD